MKAQFIAKNCSSLPIPTFPGSSLSLYYDNIWDPSDEREMEGDNVEDEEDESEKEEDSGPVVYMWDDGAVDECGFRIVDDLGLQGATGDSLELRENIPTFDPDGHDLYMAQCKGLGVIPSTRFLNGLGEGVINMKFFGVDPRSIRAMAQALYFNDMVHTLNLTGNKLSNAAAYNLGIMLRENFNLRHLVLRDCQLGAEGAELVVLGLETNGALEVLDLSGNGIGDAGTQAMQEVLGQNTALSDLDLSNNRLFAPAAASLAKAMRVNETVHTIRLGRNSLYDDVPKGLKPLLGALQIRPRFLCLDLEWNALNDSAAVPIKTFFVKSQSVKEVFLNNNRFSSSAINQIKTGVTKCSSLQYLRIGFNPMDSNDALILLRACPQTMHTLDLSGINVSKDFRPLKKKLETSCNMNIITEGTLSAYDIKGSHLGEMMLKRARFEGFKPKKKKMQRDFGHILLELASQGRKTMLPEQFTEFALKTKKVKVRQELLRNMYTQFRSKKKFVDIEGMLQCYMKLFPETVLPHPVEKKPNTGKNGKERKKKK